jgi:hypothetical protein
LWKKTAEIIEDYIALREFTLGACVPRLNFNNFKLVNYRACESLIPPGFLGIALCEDAME